MSKAGEADIFVKEIKKGKENKLIIIEHGCHPKLQTFISPKNPTTAQLLFLNKFPQIYILLNSP